MTEERDESDISFVTRREGDGRESQKSKETRSFCQEQKCISWTKDIFRKVSLSEVLVADVLYSKEVSRL